jgi:hypothetical protein
MPYAIDTWLRFVELNKIGKVIFLISPRALGRLGQSLEQKLQASLSQTRSRRAYDVTESRAGDISIDGLRSEELGVVEDVEPFEPKLEGFRLGQAHVLEKGHIGP